MASWLESRSSVASASRDHVLMQLRSVMSLDGYGGVSSS